jgi:hypothetical protein
VPTKTPEQQSCLMLHRTRHLFIRQQTAVINAIRAHLAEFGIVAPVGRNGVEQLLDVSGVGDTAISTGATSTYRNSTNVFLNHAQMGPEPLQIHFECTRNPEQPHVSFNFGDSALIVG